VRVEEGDAAESRAEVAPLVSAVYPPDVLSTIVWRDVVSARSTRRIVVYDDRGKVVSMAGMLFRDAQVNGLPRRIGGIGGVMTLPVAQGQGFGRAAMHAAHEICRGNKTLSFGLLFCEPKNSRFYEGLGWRAFSGTVVAEQSGTNSPYEVMPAMVLSLAEPAPVDGTIDLCGLPW
jgi:aminoglycoside 2'-N-acetyltransferase I